MGAIVFWALMRIAVIIPALWILYGYIEYRYWWWVSIFAIAGIVIYPATVQYRIFIEDNSEIINNTLCASCKSFDESAVLCMKHDKHPTENELPCEGLDWEPKGNNEKEEEI
jgi:hypothetical protein